MLANKTRYGISIAPVDRFAATLKDLNDKARIARPVKVAEGLEGLGSWLRRLEGVAKGFTSIAPGLDLNRLYGHKGLGIADIGARYRNHPLSEFQKRFPSG